LPFIQNEGKIDKAGWECALMAKIDKEIRGGNISIANSKRFNEFDKFFTSASDWNLKRDNFFKRAKLPVSTPEIKVYLRSKIGSLLRRYKFSLFNS
jgi:hypothetical protein